MLECLGSAAYRVPNLGMRISLDFKYLLKLSRGSHTIPWVSVGLLHHVIEVTHRLAGMDILLRSLISLGAHYTPGMGRLATPCERSDASLGRNGYPSSDLVG